MIETIATLTERSRRHFASLPPSTAVLTRLGYTLGLGMKMGLRLFHDEARR
jgi:hypothetical protein